MADRERWNVLAAALSPEDAVYQQHIAGFVRSFVVKSRRDRWLYQLSKRPARLHGSSYRIHGDLDKARCSLVKDEGSLGVLRGDGIYYEFTGEPKVLSVQDALAIGSGQDAIFTLVAGKVALFFFHEDEIWLCQV